MPVPWTRRVSFAGGYNSNGQTTIPELFFDADRDGFEDRLDTFPFDPSESLDSDNDGIGNNADVDDDNDSLSDADEVLFGTDPVNADTDGDSLSDGQERDLGLNPLDVNDCPEDYCPSSSYLLKLIPILIQQNANPDIGP